MFLRRFAMRTRLFAHRLFSLLVSVSLVLTPAVTQAVSLRTNQSPVLHAVSLQPAPPAQDPGPVWLPFVGRGQVSAPTSDLLYRVHITVSGVARWQRLEQLGVVVLSTAADQGGADQGSADQSASPVSAAVVLVDFDQLAQLARLQFHPVGADEVSRLVNAGGTDRPWLTRSLHPLLEQAAAVGRTGNPTYEIDAASALSAEQIAALDSLRAAMRGLSGEQRAGLALRDDLDLDGVGRRGGWRGSKEGNG